MSPRTIGWARAIPRSCIAAMSMARATCLNAAQRAGVRRIVYTSSVATIGIPGDGTPGDEQTAEFAREHDRPLQALEIPGRRAGAEAARDGLSVVIVSPSTPVGPGDVKPTPTGQLVLDAAAGRMPAYVDTGLNIVHVDDVAAGHLLAYERGKAGERYILGGQDMSLREILEMIAALVGRSAAARAAALWPWFCPSPTSRKGSPGSPAAAGASPWKACACRARSMFFSSAKAARELGYRWRPPAQAFEDAIRWFRDNGL